jgi:hypothetical protein
MQTWGIETHPKFHSWVFFYLIASLQWYLSGSGSYDIFCACSGTQKSQLWSSHDNPNILHIHLYQSGIYPHFRLSQNWYNVILDLPLPWLPFCVKMGTDFFSLCKSRGSVRGNIGYIFHSSFAFSVCFRVPCRLSIWLNLHYY